ncbi:sulfite exporter TauE/SafE family protein [Trifolium repens]|nr:sulfite exporter TauE/SafE family protein [Trifolium repens]
MRRCISGSGSLWMSLDISLSVRRTISTSVRGESFLAMKLAKTRAVGFGESVDDKARDSERRVEDATLDLQAGEPVNESQTNTNLPRKKVSVIENVYWRNFDLFSLSGS